MPTGDDNAVFPLSPLGTALPEGEPRARRNIGGLLDKSEFFGLLSIDNSECVLVIFVVEILFGNPVLAVVAESGIEIVCRFAIQSKGEGVIALIEFLFFSRGQVVPVESVISSVRISVVGIVEDPAVHVSLPADVLLIEALSDLTGIAVVNAQGIVHYKGAAPFSPTGTILHIGLSVNKEEGLLSCL